MSEGPFLNIEAPKALRDRSGRLPLRHAEALPGCRGARATRSGPEGVLRSEPVHPGDPDHALARARRRQPADALPIREAERITA